MSTRSVVLAVACWVCACGGGTPAPMQSDSAGQPAIGTPSAAGSGGTVAAAAAAGSAGSTPSATAGSGGAGGANDAAGSNAPSAGSGGASMGAAGASGSGSVVPMAGSGAATPELAVTADFLNRTLSIVDIGKLRMGGTRADALVGSVDLAMYSPGPMSLAITPDGKTALVSISSGFLGAFITVPPGAGTLLFVDIATRKVTGEIAVGDSPMGIVVSKDGKRAFVGLYSENYFAVVDLEKKTFERVSTGSGFNEELAIDDSGTVGIVTYGPSGNVRTFSIEDPAGSLGATFGLTGDAAGVAFFPGTKVAFLMQAPTILTGNVGGHDVVDVSNPASPVAHGGPRVGSHPTTYPVTAVAARGSVAFTSTQSEKVSVVEMKLEGEKATEVKRVEVGTAASLAYGLSATRDGRVLIAVPGEHYVGVVDLAAGTAFTVPWEVTMSGPTEIKVVP